MDVWAFCFPHCPVELHDVHIPDATEARYRNKNKRPSGTAKGAQGETARKYEETVRLAGHIFYPFVTELDE